MARKQTQPVPNAAPLRGDIVDVEDDPQFGGHRFVVTDPQGKRRIFRPLSASDRLALANRLKRERKDELKENLTFSQITGKEALTYLNEYDARDVDRESMLSYGLRTEAGNVETLRLALQRETGKECSDGDVDQLGLTSLGYIRLVARLLRLKTDEDGQAKPVSKAGVGSDPLPGSAAEASPKTSDVT